MKHLRRRLNPRHRFGSPAERRAATGETIQLLELLEDPDRPRRERREASTKRMNRFVGDAIGGAVDSLRFDELLRRKPDPMGALAAGLARAGLNLFVAMLPTLYPPKPKAKRKRRRGRR